MLPAKIKGGYLAEKIKKARHNQTMSFAGNRVQKAKSDMQK
jgi:hypothetical protein